MDTFNEEAFWRLARVVSHGDGEQQCVTILMPTHRTGEETKQDPIRLKSLLDEAEERLVAGGRRAADVRERLGSLRRLVDDAHFWIDQELGLVACCLPEETLVYGTPFTLPERVVAGRRCYVTPLFPVICEDRKFYVLSLSPKQVRLVEGSRYTAKEADLPGWPDEFKELLQYIEEEPQLQFHTGAQPVGDGRRRAAVFHGQPGGEVSSEQKLRLSEYCRLVDRRVRKAIGSDTGPLVLACDERLASIYHEITDDARVMRQPVAGNPDDRDPADLCREAWEIVRPEVEQFRETAVARCRQAAGTGRAAMGLSAVLPAVEEGRVDTLLVAGDDVCWGQYVAQQRRIDIHDEPLPDDEELLNLAAVLALEQGADVYPLPREDVPENQLAVAALRY